MRRVTPFGEWLAEENVQVPEPLVSISVKIRGGEENNPRVKGFLYQLKQLYRVKIGCDLNL